MPINQFTDKARAVERLLEEARKRGVHVRLVLLDRAFFTVEVISVLKRLGIRFIIPAVKNRKVKYVIEDHHRSKTDAVQRFTLGIGDNAVSFNLAIYPRPEDVLRKKRGTICERYIAFATNLSKAVATQPVKNPNKSIQNREKTSERKTTFPSTD